MSRLRLSLGTCALVLSVAACQNAAGITAPDSPARDGIGGLGSGHRMTTYNGGMAGSGGRLSDPATTTTLDGIGTAGSGHRATYGIGMGGSGSLSGSTTQASSDSTGASLSGIGTMGTGH